MECYQIMEVNSIPYKAIMNQNQNSNEIYNFLLQSIQRNGFFQGMNFFEMSIKSRQELEKVLDIHNYSHKLLLEGILEVQISSEESILIAYNQRAVCALSLLTHQIYKVDYGKTILFLQLPKLSQIEIGMDTKEIEKMYRHLKPYVDGFYFNEFGLQNVFYIKMWNQYVLLTGSEIVPKNNQTIQFSLLNFLENRNPYVYLGKELTWEDFNYIIKMEGSIYA